MDDVGCRCQAYALVGWYMTPFFLFFSFSSSFFFLASRWKGKKTPGVFGLVWFGLVSRCLVFDVPKYCNARLGRVSHWFSSDGQALRILFLVSGPFECGCYDDGGCERRAL